MQSKCVVQVTKLFERSNLANDGGLDVHLRYTYLVRPFETKQLFIDGHYVLAPGYMASVHPRSSIASRGLLIHTTVIDAEYTGRLFIIATNLSKEDVVVAKGSRVAQLVVSPVIEKELKLVNEEDLNGGQRNDRCLGSTGI